MRLGILDRGGIEHFGADAALLVGLFFRENRGHFLVVGGRPQRAARFVLAIGRKAIEQFAPKLPGIARRWTGAYRRLVVELLAGGSYVDGDAAVAGSARLERSAVGAGCRVGRDVALTRSVVVAGASVGDGAVLEDCIAAGPVELPVGTRATRELLLPCGRVPLL